MKKLLLALIFLPWLHAPAVADTVSGTNQVKVTGKHAVQHTENQLRVTEKHAVEHTSPYAGSNIPDVGWKSSDRYELSYIDGFQEIYNAQEPIVINVEGKSDKMDVDLANGFYVSAIIYEASRRTMEKQVLGEYDSSRRVWQVKIDAPTDNNKRYELYVALFCSKTNSPCATAYGEGTQVDKVLPLQVR